MKLALVTLALLFFGVAVWALGTLAELDQPVISSIHLK